VAKAGKKHSTPEAPLKAMFGLLYGQGWEQQRQQSYNSTQRRDQRSKIRAVAAERFGAGWPPANLPTSHALQRLRKALKDDNLPIPSADTLRRAIGRR
jgi:hypothetical protein